MTERKIPLVTYVSEEEKAKIMEKVEESSEPSFSTWSRKMLLLGAAYIIDRAGFGFMLDSEMRKQLKDAGV